MLGEIVPSGSKSRTSMWESAMREGEICAESDGHLRRSAAKPAVLSMRNSRRPGICAFGNAVQDFRKTVYKCLQGRWQANTAPSCAPCDCLYDVQERVPMGHVDSSFSAIQLVSPRQLAFQRERLPGHLLACKEFSLELRGRSSRACY
jgi:hypothetical protein